MADIVNLRQARKRAARVRESELADENRVRHGLPKGERLRQSSERDRSARDLEAKRLGKPEPSRDA